MAAGDGAIGVRFNRPDCGLILPPSAPCQWEGRSNFRRNHLALLADGNRAHFGGFVEREEIEKNPENLPYWAHDALRNWRKATRDREVLEAIKCLAFKEESISKGAGRPLSDEMAKTRCRSTPEWRMACDTESDQEAAYYLLDKLLWIELKKKDNG